MNVFPAHAGVGAEVPVEGERDVVQRAALNVTAIQIDERPPCGNFPRATTVLDSGVGPHAKEVLERIDPVDCAECFIVGAIFAGQKVADESVSALEEERGAAGFYGGA